jgi:hypothetical protein
MSKHRPLFRFALAIGLICGVVSFFVFDPYLIRARCAASSRESWLRFNHSPSEGDIFDEVLDIDPVFSPSDRLALRSNQGKGAFRLRTFGKIYVDVSPFEESRESNPASHFAAHARVNPDGTLAGKPLEIGAASGKIYVWTDTTKPTAADLAELEKYEAASNRNMWDLLEKGWEEKEYYRPPPFWLTEPSTRYVCPKYLSRTVYFVGSFVASAGIVFAACMILSLAWYFFLARLSELSVAIRAK